MNFLRAKFALTCNTFLYKWTYKIYTETYTYRFWGGVREEGRKRERGKELEKLCMMNQGLSQMSAGKRSSIENWHPRGLHYAPCRVNPPSHIVSINPNTNDMTEMGLMISG